MGQRGSSEVQGWGTCAPPHAVPSHAPAWSLILTDTVDNWNQFAGAYGFIEIPHGCVGRDCDRDSICLKHAKAVLRKSSCNVEVQRFKRSPVTVSYGANQELKTKVSQGFNLSEVIAALQGESALLIFYRWERLKYEAVFVLVDLVSRRIRGTFNSPMINMSIMECKISPDGSCIAILFYLRHTLSLPFNYDLYIVSTETFKVTDKIHCNEEVRPYISFDPRYGSSRIAIVNFNSRDDEGREVKNGLVLYCLQLRQVVSVSHVMLSIIYCGGYFCLRYTRDGRYIILQKITDNMNGIHCYADSYVFDSSSLKLLKHYFANLQSFSTLCYTNYAPAFSVCSSRMCIMSEEYHGLERKLQVQVYQLPRPLSLQGQCRITILQSLKSTALVCKLPLPRRIKDFLNFAPELT